MSASSCDRSELFGCSARLLVLLWHGDMPERVGKLAAPGKIASDPLKTQAPHGNALGHSVDVAIINSCDAVGPGQSTRYKLTQLPAKYL